MKLSVFKKSKKLREIDFSTESELDRSGASVEFYIGRADDCHVILEGKNVSRHHAKIIKSNDQWKIEKISDFGDLILNGLPSENKELNDGDSMAIDDYQIRVQMSAGIVSTDAVVPNNVEPIGETEQNDQEVTAVIESVNLSDGEENIDSLNLGEADSEIQMSEDLSTEQLDMGDVGDLDLGAGSDESEENQAVDAESDGLDLSMDDDAIEDNSEDDSLALLGDNSDSDDEEENVSLGGDLELDLPDDNTDIKTNSEDVPESNDEINEFNNDETDDIFGGETEENGIDLTSDDEGFDSDKTLVAAGFNDFQLQIFGEFAPYDKYTLDAPEVFIGRDKDKCKIFLDDTEVSMLHARIIKEGGQYYLEDYKSSNGTVLNGSRINKSPLATGDEFIIGNTTFSVNSSSNMLNAEKNALMPVEKSQVMEVEEILEVDAAEMGTSASIDNSSTNFDFSGSKSSGAGSDKKKLIIRGAIFLGLVYFLVAPDEDEIPKKPKAQTTKQAKTDNNKQATKKPVKPKRKALTAEEIQQAESLFQLAQAQAGAGKWTEAMVTLDKLKVIDTSYKQAKDLENLVKESLAKIEKVEREKREEEERKIREEKVKLLLEKASSSVKNREVEVARALFNQILEIDPQNVDVTPLKLELDAWEEAKKRKELEEAQKKSERNRKVSQLALGKKLFLKGDWYRAAQELEKFLEINNMDEDLQQEAAKMLKESKIKIDETIGPLVRKARSFKEGDDLKNAYQSYKKILKFDPNHSEAHKEIKAIKDKITKRAKNVFREAMILESLSFFDEAKEKYQEVQQISPLDSEYYRKATQKLEDY